MDPRPAAEDDEAEGEDASSSAKRRVGARRRRRSTKAAVRPQASAPALLPPRPPRLGRPALTLLLGLVLVGAAADALAADRGGGVGAALAGLGPPHPPAGTFSRIREKAKRRRAAPWGSRAPASSAASCRSAFRCGRRSSRRGCSCGRGRSPLVVRQAHHEGPGGRARRAAPCRCRGPCHRRTACGTARRARRSRPARAPSAARRAGRSGRARRTGGRAWPSCRASTCR